MTWYDEKRIQILKFAKEAKMQMCDVARIAKDLSTCEKCKFYCQHYDKGGVYVPFGHCNRLSNKARKPHESSCGFWEYGGDPQNKEE